MPYSSRRYSKPRGVYVKKQPTAKQIAYRALKAAQRSEKKKEVKHNAVTVADTTPDSTGSIEELSVLSAGDSNNNREGDVVFPTSLRFRGRLVKNASATTTQVRMLIFQWLSEAPGAVSDILVSTSVQSFKSENNRYQSRILYDRVFTLDSASKDSMFIQKTIKLKGMIAYPQSSSAANRNGIWVLLLSNEATNVPTLNLESRLYFKDA